MINMITVKEEDFLLIKQKAIDSFRSLRKAAFKEVDTLADAVINNKVQLHSKESLNMSDLQKTEILKKAFLSILSGIDTMEYELFTNWLVEFQTSKDNIPLVAFPSSINGSSTLSVIPIDASCFICDYRLSSATLMNVIAWWLTTVRKLHTDDVKSLYIMSSNVYRDNNKYIYGMGASINEELQKTIEEDI